MAENYLWDNQSPNPTSDVENPSPAFEANVPPNNRAKCNTFSTSKAVKLALGITAVAGAVALGVVLGLNSSSDEPEVIQAVSSATSVKSLAADDDKSGKKTKSKKQEFYTSSGSLEAKVKMVSSSITDGYETCSDLEKDITEALKLYISNYINSEAENNEIYAKCDPDNENWYWEYYGYDDYYYHDYYNTDYTCDPSSNSTFTCDIKDGDAPWVVTWHELDHAEGTLFYNKTEALEAYGSIDSSYAKRLYCPYRMVVEQYGSMGGHDWCELETFAYEAQCTGEVPSAPTKRTAAKKTVPISSIKQTRSSLPLKKQTRSNSRSVNKDKKTSHAKRSGGSEGSGFEQNSQNDNVNEKDKVVSDGSFVYAAYGDVLQVWSANGSTEEVSITQMPGEVKDCDWDTTEPCTSSSKPSIQALFLGNGRLTVVITQYEYVYGTSDQAQPIITDYGSKLAVAVYDVSTVTLGSPLNELAFEELTGSFLDGGSIGNGDKTVIATSSSINTWVITEDVSRSQLQYCGLNTTAYMELAKSTAESQIASLAKQMVNELELVNDCSGIVRVSTMQDGSIDNVSNLSTSDFLLGSFIQLFTLDVSSADGDIPAYVAGSFSPSGGYNLYITDDFIALPSSIYSYNSTTGSDDYLMFILGFGLSADGVFKPTSYGYIPGEVYNNYRMDKKDGYLRILPFEYISSTDEDMWTMTYFSKVYVLELPSTSGAMTLVGESKLFGEDGSYYVSSSRFSGDLAFLSGDDYEYENQLPFVVLDLSDPSSPKTVGSLEVDCSLSYLQEVDVNGAPYIIGIGIETDSTTYQNFLVIALIDVSTPSEPKLAAYHKSESGSSSDANYDFLSIRYFDGSLIIPVSISKYNETTYVSTYTDTFVVYDITETTITPAFDVTHSTDYNYCYYDAAVPPRSFVINSELTTIKGHTAIRTDMAGNVLSELDLDKGFNYTFCPDYSYYYDYGYNDDDETDDST